MACCPTANSYGYESCRFEKDVDENFHCSICYNVLKEPRTCRNNDHMFCLEQCITEHLTVNTKTCPECNEHLSVDTLRRPRVVCNILLNLKINCDYASRGCPEFVRVEELQIHVENCNFAPVLCSNEECGMKINKQDKVHHETEVCEYRKMRCHECGQINEAVEKLESSYTEMDNKMAAIRQDQHEVVDEIKAVKENQQEIRKEVREVKKEVKDLKVNISKVTKDVDEVKVMMSQMLEKLNMLELSDKLPSPSEGVMNTPRGDILIVGGSGPSKKEKKSTEIYSWEKNGWFVKSTMNEEHKRASSFIHRDQLFVVGGEKIKIIETLDLNGLLLKWIKFPGELLYACDDHQTVVYQQRIIHIGRCNYDERKVSNVVSELQLSSPCIIKELCQMPEPRECHGAEIFEDKVLIMGGENEHGDVLESVLKFDVTKNEYTEMPPLPRSLKNMATVRWRDKVVVLGGRDEDYEVFNDVFMYDCKTGKITTLPSMLEKRCACCAVITRNTIVVMGGYDDNGDDLKSVERFTMGGSSWEYLPDMKVARWGAIADVLPSARKYV